MNAVVDASLQASSLEQLELARLLAHVAGYCSSSLGATLLKEAEPLKDVARLDDELGMVAEARSIIVEGERIPVDGIHDLRNRLALATVQGNFLDGEDLVAVGRTLSGMRRMRGFFSDRVSEAPLLRMLTDPIHSNRLLEKHISDALDDKGNVRDSASRALFDIRRDIIAKSAKLRDRLGSILRRVSEDDLLTDEYVTLAEGRLVLPVRVEYKRRLPGIIHGESKTGSTVYLEPAEIFDMNNEIAELRFAERREIEKVLRVLTAEIGAEAEEIAEGLWRAAAVDSVAARARYAEEYDCCRPTVTSDGTLLVEGGRHPGLALRSEEVVPMSIELGTETRCVIISGPNAGGKTVAMKTLGLVAMLTQCGFHPPADRVVLTPCTLYSDIGDRQSVENDLSTFSAHMGRLRDILAIVERGDIVLLDELGTGTDPDEGAAIAAAILDRLLQAGALVMATTHHSALKIFAYDRDGVDNAGMEFDTGTLEPTYRLMLGVPGNSYAFELLDRFGFSDEIIRTARASLGEDRNAMSDVVEKLETALAEARKRSAEAAVSAAAAEKLRLQLESEKAALKTRRQELIAEARSEARQVLEGANSLVENTIREVRSGATNDEVQKMRAAIEDAKQSSKKPKTTQQIDAGPFAIGTQVRLVDGTEAGEVLAAPDEKGYVLVQFGPIRMRSHTSEVQELSRSEVREATRVEKRRTSSATTNMSEPKTRVDLRGQYVDGAMQEIESALASALSNGIMRIEVIHGKGTGALRRATQQLLDGHPAVASFRSGSLSEGGDGVTIVELN